MHKINKPQKLALAIKRSIDIVVAALALVVLAPLMLVLALVIRLALGSPIFFRQLRPGFREKPFVLYKFRTMRELVADDGRPLPDEARITRLGKLLRRTSLDELPQFWNVLKGDMSLIGPRPLLVEYLPLYNAQQRRRHEMRPGLTGLAQARGRNRLDWEDRFHWDVWYVDHWSLWLDLKIVCETFTELVKTSILEGRPGGQPVTPFRGPTGDAR